VKLLCIERYVAANTVAVIFQGFEFLPWRSDYEFIIRVFVSPREWNFEEYPG